MDTIRLAVQDWVSRSQSAILVTGGTGLGVRDITPEAIEPLYTRLLPGYGELFRMLSYEQVGAAAMLSRASGGVIENTVVLTMPGSPKAVDLAMQKLILPELGHLVSHASEPKKSDPS
jgi:molybdenum cofactor biosynthesis protein B